MAEKKCRCPETPPPQTLRRSAAVRSLLVIDEEPLRRAALARYLKVEKQGTRLRARIERFETIDRPAYERWEATTFGPLLTELRECSAALREKERVLDAIDEEMLWSSCSQLTAYRRVMKLLSDPDEEAPGDARNDFDTAGTPEFSDERRGLFGESDLPSGFSVEDYECMTAAAKREFRALYETMAELYEAATGQPAPQLDEVLAHERARSGGADPEGAPRTDVSASAPSASEENSGARLKELYRRIVRQLHPDTNGEFGPRERELWHEAQVAYGEFDLERLEAVAARIELNDAGTSARTPVGVLLKITRELRAGLRSLLHQLALAKKQPAWRFPERAAELPTMEARRHRNLAQALAGIRHKLADATAILDELAGRAASLRTQKAAGGSAQPARGRQREFF